MRNAVIFVALALASVACPIEVDPVDGSAPELSVSLVDAQGLSAHYTDGSGEPIEAVIDPDRPFTIAPRNDRAPVTFVFTARDGQSGVSQLVAQVAADYTCGASGTLVQGERKRAGTTVTDRAGSPAAGGEEVSDRVFTSVSFTVEELWRRGDCTRWGQIIEHGSGTITDVTLELSANAANNGSPLQRSDIAITGTSSPVRVSGAT